MQSSSKMGKICLVIVKFLNVVILASGIILINCYRVAVIILSSNSCHQTGLDCLVWFPAVLSCRFLLIASVVNSLVTRLHVTLQQTLDTSLPFHK